MENMVWMLSQVGWVVAQAELDPGSALTWIERGGVIALLTIIVVGSLQEWWVPGVTYRRALEGEEKALIEAEKWRDIAIRNVSVSSSVVEAVKQTNGQS